MLNAKDALATIAVKSVKDARRFYGDVLGLTIEHTPEKDVLTVKSGKTTVLVYESQFAGTNQATAATWIRLGLPEPVSCLTISPRSNRASSPCRSTCSASRTSRDISSD